MTNLTKWIQNGFNGDLFSPQYRVANVQNNRNEKVQVLDESAQEENLSRTISGIAIPVLLTLGIVLIPVGGHLIAGALLLGGLLIAAGFLCWFAAAFVVKVIDDQTKDQERTQAFFAQKSTQQKYPAHNDTVPVFIQK